MKKYIVILLLLLIAQLGFSQKSAAIGWVDTKYHNGMTISHSYDGIIATGNARSLKDYMFNKLSRTPGVMGGGQYDGIMVVTGEPGELYTTIIEYNHRYGVGIARTYQESKKEAESFLVNVLGLRVVPNYKTLESKNLGN